MPRGSLIPGTWSSLSPQLQAQPARATNVKRMLVKPRDDCEKEESGFSGCKASHVTPSPLVSCLLACVTFCTVTPVLPTEPGMAGRIKGSEDLHNIHPGSPGK